jgi:hypothetical protein
MHAGQQPQWDVSKPQTLPDPHLDGSSRLAETRQKIKHESAHSEQDDLSVPEAVSQVWGMLRTHAQRALKELRPPK